MNIIQILKNKLLPETYNNYKEYLQTHHWQKIRKIKLAEAEYRCQFCNASKCQLNVHHRTYKNLGHEKLNDLVVLCRTCHKLFHKERRLHS